MKCSSIHVLIFSVAFFTCLCQVWAIKCMVCQDCAEPRDDANSTRECGKKEDRCVKMILVNDEVDRGCTDTAKCAGRVPTRKPRSLPRSKPKPEELTNNAPKQRTIRQLLAPPSKGGGDGKTPAIEIAAMFCCDEDMCNGATLNRGYHHYLLLSLAALIFYSYGPVLLLSGPSLTL